MPSKEKAHSDGYEIGKALREVYLKTGFPLLEGRALMKEADKRYDDIAGYMKSPYYYSDTESRLHYSNGFIAGYAGETEEELRIVYEYRLTPWQQFWKWVQSLFTDRYEPKEERPLE